MLPSYNMIINLYCTSDIHECDDGTNGCEHNCTNNEGSFTCSCMSGFRLDENGKNCTGE